MTSTKTNVPHIGFDRFIPLDWAACALRVRAGQETSETLEALIGEKERSEASRKKTRSVLKGLWLAPRADLTPFADRGAELLAEVDASAVPALCWGMAISAYPFFGKVAELTGRLTAIQGDCASKEIHRRMAETYGERETAYRAANRVMQTQADWGSLDARRQRPPHHPTGTHDHLPRWPDRLAYRGSTPLHRQGHVRGHARIIGGALPLQP